jgi:hypothetical protein
MIFLVSVTRIATSLTLIMIPLPVNARVLIFYRQQGAATTLYTVFLSGWN